MFHLHAELELDQEETELIQKYGFTYAPMILSDPIDDLKMAFRPAFLLGVVIFVVMWSSGSFTSAIPFSVLVIIGMTIVYFRTMREQILVSDLLNGGRVFRCDSIVELVRKEAYLESISAYLRQVLESAKNWHDREVLPITPLDKKSAKEAVLKMLHG